MGFCLAFELRKGMNMPHNGKIIITCAVTGAIHTPSMSPYLPITASEIIEQAVGAAEAGASILHLHGRNESNGRRDQTPEAFGRFCHKSNSGPTPSSI